MDSFFVGKGRAEFTGSAILVLQQQVQNSLFTVNGTDLEYVLQGTGSMAFSGTATVIG